MVGFIIGCEVAFWVFVLAGLVCRYLLGRRRTGAALLICTPVVDLALLVAAAIDLDRGAEAGLTHGLAAIYIGASVAWGHSMIRWADARFARRFAGVPLPEKRSLYGAERARQERAGWYRHLLAWAIGCALLYGMMLWVNDESRTASLKGLLSGWSVVLAIDFLISFSYTLFPRRPKGAA